MQGYGLIHIYCGEGKGKTTAAAGLAVRSAGAGKRVLFVQFFKNGNSSEIKSLRKLDGIQTLHSTTVPDRFSQMNEKQQLIAKADYTKLLEDAIVLSSNFDLLVLDEIISACNYGIIDQNRLVTFLDHKPEFLEVVLTGRNPSPTLIERADYITEMKKIKHPYNQGIRARKGIEF